MRLTVGPLPATVYWRRRAVVLVGLAMVVLVVSYACGGPDTNAGAQVAGSAGPSGTPSPSVTLLHPEVPATSPAATSSPSPSAFTLPVAAATGPCTDAEMEVTATAAPASVARGAAVMVSIRIKNISTRTCQRDIGADAQELRLMYDKVIVWSSDDCGANHGHDVEPLDPGQEASFTIPWNGRRSRLGEGIPVCDTTETPGPEIYALVARLDQKLSAPFEIRIG